MDPSPESDADSSRDPFDELAEEFAERYRRGERPSVEEYAGRHPEAAGEIRRLLETVAFLERGKGRGAAAPGSGPGPGPGAGGIATAATLMMQLGENRGLSARSARAWMGIVYEAIQEPLGRRVVVRSSEAFAGRRAEPLAVPPRGEGGRMLTHLHIVLIHALREQDGMPYYVHAPDRRRRARPPAGRPGDGKAPPGDPVARAVGRGAGVGRRPSAAHGMPGVASSTATSSRRTLLLDSCGTLWLANGPGEARRRARMGSASASAGQIPLPRP